MYIDPIRAAQAIGNATGAERTSAVSSASASFENMLWQSLAEVSETEGAVQGDVLRLAAGATGGLHNIAINAAKADLAIQTVVSVRNKALEAYNEIMRITL